MAPKHRPDSNIAAGAIASQVGLPHTMLRAAAWYKYHACCVRTQQAGNAFVNGYDIPALGRRASEHKVCGVVLCELDVSPRKRLANLGCRDDAIKVASLMRSS